MSDDVRTVPFNFRLGELTLGAISRRLAVPEQNPFTETAATDDDDDDALASLPARAHGVLYRSKKIETPLDVLELSSRRIRYVPRQYERYFADLRMPYDDYVRSFSSKSRSTLRRKVRKLERASGGQIQWKRYRSREEMETFYRLAREISAQTYQERLLDAGLPDSDAFRTAMLASADAGNVRGFLVFLHGEAIAYLYCPIRNGIVRYAYLGYLPKYQELSPGTVLLWMALEDLFDEGTHRIFDFTEGGDRSKHSQKRFFATGRVTCADIYLLKPKLANALVVLAHRGSERFVEGIGNWLESLGIKKHVRNVTRRLWGTGSTESKSG